MRPCGEVKNHKLKIYYQYIPYILTLLGVVDVKFVSDVHSTWCELRSSIPRQLLIFVL